MSKATTLALLTLSIAAVACGGEPCDMGINNPGEIPFFAKFRRDELGSTKYVEPRPATQGTGRGANQKMIDLAADDALATGIIVSFRAEYSQNQATVSQMPGPGGTLVGPPPGTGVEQLGAPLVGRVEWGVGGGFQAIEVDIPGPRVPGLQFPFGSPANFPIDDLGNGVQVLVTGSAVRAYARNDSNIGLGVNATLPVQGTGPGFIAKVIAFVSPAYGRGGPPVKRTIYLCRGAGGVAGGALPAGGSAVVTNVPLFARRVWIHRFPIATTPLNVQLRDTQSVTVGEVNLPVNSIGPIELFNAVTDIRIANNGAVEINDLTAVYDVDPI
jgi:hypothetical protein